ncbi:MAG: ATP-binding protein [Anaerolineae bacterium]
MTALHADPVLRDDIMLELNDLRLRLTAMFAGAFVLAGALVSWAVLPGNAFPRDVFWVFLSVFLGGLFILALNAHRTRLAWMGLLLCPSLSLAFGLRLIDSPAVAFFAPLIVIATTAISPALGFAAAGLNTLPITLFLWESPLLWPALACLWLATALAWISSRGFYTVLQMSWNSQQRANRLLAELRQRQGELNQTLVALTEATRRLQRTGYELAVARSRADEARQLKEQFAANISHELRTPLNLILGFSEMMYMSPEVYGDMPWPSTLRRDVQQIHRSSRQLLDLVNDVLDLSRVDAALMPVAKESADLGAVIHEAVETMTDLVRGRGLVLRAEVPDSLPPLSFDRVRIRQVLLNLLNNAARFTPAGAISVSAQVVGHEVEVSVTDSGQGISPEELRRIFDPFHQVDMSLRRQREGAGLGLAISKRFVELHGGRIWAESEVAHGSTFRFSLPLNDESSVARLVTGRSVPPSEADYRPTVLIIDSNPEVGVALAKHLRPCQVVQAAGVAEAVELVPTCEPHLALLNVGPSEKEWHEAQHQDLNNLPRDLPILFCSLPSQNWQHLDPRVRYTLSKPVRREQLIATLRDLGDVHDILIVDDDSGFAQLVNRFVAGNGSYSVRWASDGEEALRLLRARRADVILLDLAMPGMDGFQFLQEYRTGDEVDVPIVIVTAASAGDRGLAGSTGHLELRRQRSYSTVELVRYLRAMLEVITMHESPTGSALGLPEGESG